VKLYRKKRTPTMTKMSQFPLTEVGLLFAGFDFFERASPFHTQPLDLLLNMILIILKVK